MTGWLHTGQAVCRGVSAIRVRLKSPHLARLGNGACQVDHMAVCLSKTLIHQTPVWDPQSLERLWETMLEVSDVFCGVFPKMGPHCRHLAISTGLQTRKPWVPTWLGWVTSPSRTGMARKCSCLGNRLKRPIRFLWVAHQWQQSDGNLMCQ